LSPALGWELLGLNSSAPGRDKMDAVEELDLVIDGKH
jgi:hypothetical protein